MSWSHSFNQALNLDDEPHKVHFGDARKSEEIVNEPVDLIVTSPPYFDLKDYDHPHQIGFGGTFDKYIGQLKLVFDQCFRLLNPGCRCCVVIGDSYRSDEQGYRVVPTHSRFVTSMVDCGFQYMGSIIWRKISTTNTSGGGKWMGSTYYPKDGCITYENEYISIFKKPGKSKKPSSADKALSKLTKQQRSEYFRGVWEIPGARQNSMAVFPLELPLRLVKMFSFYGETVLDPFLGSGTTMEACQKLGRRCVGVEISDVRVTEIAQKVSRVPLLQ